MHLISWLSCSYFTLNHRSKSKLPEMPCQYFLQTSQPAFPSSSQLCHSTKGTLILLNGRRQLAFFIGNNAFFVNITCQPNVKLCRSYQHVN